MSDGLRVGFSGARRASAFFTAFQAHPETEIVALCDPHIPTLTKSGEQVGVKQLYPSFEQMVGEAGLDAVVISSPMHFHAGQAIEALQRNIHVLSEVTAAVSLEEARWLVDATKSSTATYMMAENYTYMKSNVLVKAMVDAGLFGEPYYAEGEYLHELSALHRTPDGNPTWRAHWQVGINGCTYPTHSLGPCLQWINDVPSQVSCIGTGNRTAPEHAMEDTVLLLCKTRGSRLIRVRLDMLSKRPHAMTNYTLQGTKGVYESRRRLTEGDWVWLEEYATDPNEWLPLESFEREFLPAIWRDPPPEALAAGHGGGDYIEVMDFVDAALGRKSPAIDIHTAMDMTLPGLVSQESIKKDGEWLAVPDSRAW